MSTGWRNISRNIPVRDNFRSHPRERRLNEKSSGGADERRVAARYCPREASKASDYEVNPLGLVFRQRILYLVCTFRDSNDVKQLALHRFSSARLLDLRRRVPSGFYLDSYVLRGESGRPLFKFRFRQYCSIAFVKHFLDAAAPPFETGTSSKTAATCRSHLCLFESIDSPEFLTASPLQCIMGCMQC